MDATPTPATAAAIWSAIAASFAALASFLIWRIQRSNLLESVRPEIILLDWARASRGEGDGAHEVITFRSIKNIGRGAALHVFLNCAHEVDRRPTAVLATKRIPILAPNETVDIQGEVLVWWKNVAPHQGARVLPITIQIDSSDTRGMRHETIYYLFAAEFPQTAIAGGTIAPGVALVTRKTVTKAVWRHRLRARVARIPGLRSLFRQKA